MAAAICALVGGDGIVVVVVDFAGAAAIVVVVCCSCCYCRRCLRCFCFSFIDVDDDGVDDYYFVLVVVIFVLIFFQRDRVHAASRGVSAFLFPLSFPPLFLLWCAHFSGACNWTLILLRPRAAPR